MSTGDNTQINPDITYIEYSVPEFEIPAQQVIAGTAITNINSLTGPTITLAGGSSGFSYTPAGSTITLVSPLTTKGDVYTHDATNGSRLAVGTDGQILTADSASTNGIKWAAPATSGTVTSFSATPSGIFDVANPTTTPALSLDNQNANIVLAGPATGAATTPSFRALVNADLPQSAWTAWTPTITAGTGAFTSVSATGYYQLLSGKAVAVRLIIVITTNGTAATYVKSDLPVAAKDTDQVLGGKETAVTGKALTSSCFPDTSHIVIQFYDATYPGANGYRLVVQGVYESA